MRSLLSKHENFEYIVALFFLAGTLSIYSIWTARPLNHIVIMATVTLAMFFFTVWHAYLNLGFRNSMGLLAMVSFGTWFAEFLGVQGGAYHYSDFLSFKIGTVPFLVVAMWMVIVYTSYFMSEHITDYRFTRRMTMLQKFYLSSLSAALAGFIAVAWDFAMDPLAAAYGWWTWTSGGPYFASIGGGIPIGNFVGWFILVFAIVLTYKMFFEKESLAGETEFQFAPVFAYLLMYSSVLGWSIQAGLPILAFVATFTMMPFVVIILIRYFVKWYGAAPQYK